MFIYYRLVVMLACLLAMPIFANEVKHVVITTITQHPSLNRIRQGIEHSLTTEGFSLGDNLIIDYLSAQGSSATAAQIAKQLAASKPSVVVPITTPTAQAIAAATKTVPIVFVGITDPIAAKLIKNWQPSHTNITGISDALAIEPQVDFMLKIKPQLKTVGYIYSPGEINSITVLKKLTNSLTKRQIKLLAVPAQKTSDVMTAARNLSGRVDMIYTTTDNSVVSGYEALVKIAMENKIPLIASDPDSVKRGAAAAMAVGYYQFGVKAGKLIARILHGEKPGDIAPTLNNKTALFVNTEAAKKQGLVIDKTRLQAAINTITP